MLPEQKKKPWKHRVLKALMAEAVGFEPTCPCGQLHFECSSLQPLRYASMYKYSLLGTNHMISSRSRYDRFDSPPYISTVFRALRKCKKNRQERYEILKFELTKTLINQGFSAEETARANAHFESAPFDHFNTTARWGIIPHFLPLCNTLTGNCSTKMVCRRVSVDVFRLFG